MKSNIPFINLRNYTENTFQTWVPSPSEYVKKASEMNLPMVAISDKNRTHGVIEFFRAAEWKNIKPLIGVNIIKEKREYLKEEVTDANWKKKKKVTWVETKTIQNILLFPKNNEAYEAFLRIVSHINIEDADIFSVNEKEFKDIIVTVDRKTVEQYGIEYLEDFFRFWTLLFEIQTYDNTEYVNNIISRVWLDKVVLTNPTYFLNSEDVFLKNKIKAIKEKIELSDVTDDFTENYFKTKEEFFATKKFYMSIDDFEKIIDNTFNIFSDVKIELEFDIVLIPKFTLNKEDEEFYQKHKDKSPYKMWDEEWWLRYSCYRYLEERYRDDNNPNFNFSLTEDEVIEMVGRSCEPVLEKKLWDMEVDEVKKNAWSTFSEKKQAIIDRFSPEMKDIIYRLEYELYVIHHCWYDWYSLIVADYVNYAKNNGYAVWPGRWSAAGSLASYLCKITDVDPIKFDLMFERYLNFARISAPDIDVDFSAIWRQKVYEYCIERYGKENISPVCTFLTTAARTSLKDMWRIMGITPWETNRITKSMSNTPGMSLKKNMDEVGTFASIINKNETYQELYNNSLQIEGKKRQQWVHACAIIIAPKELVKFTALQYQPKKAKNLLDKTLKKEKLNALIEKEVEDESNENIKDTIDEEVVAKKIIDSSWEEYDGEAVESEVMTQLEAHDLEALWLLKMDFLVIKNLTILERTLKLIEERHWKKINISTLDYNDPFVYEKIFQPGKTTSIFQLESKGMRNNLKELKPDRLEHIIAMNALYRPGPMAFIPSYINRKNWEEDVVYLNPVLKDVTDLTYWVVVYQEQLMKMTEVYAWYSMKMADELRKWVGKKKKDIIDKHKNIFINWAVEKWHKASEAEQIYMDVIVPAGSYSFNKSHAACYAVIAFQWAYMKAYYPTEYMFACMVEATLDSNKKDLAVLVEEFTNMGGTVLPVSINKSTSLGAIEDDMVIRLWFASMAKVSETTADTIVNCRWDNPFSSFEDFLLRYKDNLSKSVIEWLAMTGWFEELWIDANLILDPDNMKEIVKLKNKNGITTKTKNVKKAFSVDLSDPFNMINKEAEELPFYLKHKNYTPITHYERALNQFKNNGFFLNVNPLSGLTNYIHKIEKNRAALFSDKSNWHLERSEKEVSLFWMISELKEYSDASNRLTMRWKLIGLDYIVNLNLNTEAAENYWYILSNNINKFIQVDWEISLSEFWKTLNVKKVSDSTKAVDVKIDSIAFSNSVRNEFWYDDFTTDMRKAFAYAEKELISEKNIFIEILPNVKKEFLLEKLSKFKEFLAIQDTGKYKVIIKDSSGATKDTKIKLKNHYYLHNYLKKEYERSGDVWCKMFVDDKEFFIWSV